MRVGDILPLLCRQPLLGEHRELHAIWSVITKKKKEVIFIKAIC